ncbi:MAG TPA: hypothetical protein ENI20_08325 [Bacteroides sp.]|nr:hypothetical protein [Bacteroides sp.]
MKKITYISLLLFALSISLAPYSQLQAQDDESESPISIGADLVSRYVWRGTDLGTSPSIQPYIEVGFGGFAIGALGAYTTNLPGVQEMDLYANYTYNDLVTVGITDYFFPDEIGGYNYFDYKNDSSGHIFEAMASFNGLEDLPLSAMIGYNFYGDNSFYIELGYGFSMFDIFLGAGNGIYTVEDPGQSDKFGIVNIGISASKEISITDNYGIPISAALITNPNSKGIHLVFGISF